MRKTRDGKRRSNKTSTVLGLAVLVAVVILRFVDPPILSEVRLRVFDFYQRLAPRPYQPAPVRVIDVDEASLKQYGQWPWPRSLLATLVDRLHQFGIAAVGFDMVFPEPDRTSPTKVLEALPAGAIDKLTRQEIERLPDNDKLFASSISRAPVVLGFGLAAGASDEPPPRKAGFSHAGTDPREFLPGQPGGVGNLAELEKSAKGLGSFSIGTAEGGVVRKIPLIYKLADTLYPALSTETLRVAQGASTYIIRSTDASGELGGANGLQAIRIGGVDVPVTKDGHLWLHYTEPVPSRLLPAAEVLDAKTPQEIARMQDLLLGHIVIVGTSAVGLKDLVTTPLRSFEAGVLVQAQAVEQMILGLYLNRPDWADGAEILGMILISLLLVVLLTRLGALWCAVLGGVVQSGILTASWLAYTKANLLLDPAYGLTAALLVYMAITFANYFRTERERGQIRQAFSTYLAPALVQQLIDEPDRLKLGGESREMTFIFTDVASFTTFSEQCEPEQLVSVLNEYLETGCRIVMEAGGTIDKIIGDAIVAIFNAPVHQPDHAERAVDCALKLDQFCNEFMTTKNSQGLTFGHTRIGVNTGTAVVGNFGGSDRFDYTAMGDPMNTAARLESVNKHLGTRICIAGSTVSQCKDKQFRPIGELVLKGKTAGVETFEPLQPEVLDSDHMQDYLRAYELLRAGNAEGRTLMLDLRQRYQDDPLIKFHAGRLEAGDEGVVIVMTDK